MATHRSARSGVTSEFKAIPGTSARLGQVVLTGTASTASTEFGDFQGLVGVLAHLRHFDLRVHEQIGG